jgi:hypothetical protein
MVLLRKCGSSNLSIPLDKTQLRGVFTCENGTLATKKDFNYYICGMEVIIQIANIGPSLVDSVESLRPSVSSWVERLAHCRQYLLQVVVG